VSIISYSRKIPGEFVNGQILIYSNPRYTELLFPPLGGSCENWRGIFDIKTLI